MKQFFQELKRRNVYKVAATYATVAFIGFQAMKLLIPSTTLPSWADELILAFLIVGFPVALVVAWAFELTPEGMRRTPVAEDVPADGSDAAAGGRAGARFGVKVLVGLGLLAGAAAGGWYLLGSGAETPEITERSVAVLPFQVSGSGAETWRDGMVTMLSTGLDGAAGIRAVADRTVLAAWRERASRAEGASTEEALSVAREVGARYAVVGSAVRLGDRLRLAADVHETPSGARLGSVEVEAGADSVTALSDSLTRRLLGLLLEESGEGLPTADLASQLTGSLPALRAYLEGERHYRAGEFGTAEDAYRRAVDHDTAFALAYWRLGSSLGWQAGTGDRFRRRAHDLAERLPRRERRLLRASWMFRDQGRALAAADTLRRLADDYPDDPAVWFHLGEAIHHHGIPGGWPEADDAISRAVELDPGHGPYYIHHVQLAISLHHDSGLAVERAEGHPNPEALEPWFPLAMDLAFGDARQRRRAVARMDSAAEPTEIRAGFLDFSLLHPEDLRWNEALARSFPEATNAEQALVHVLLRSGRIDEAVRALARVPRNATVACGLSGAVSQGFPVPDSVLASHLEPPVAGERTPLRRLLCATVAATERGREEDADRLLARIRRIASDTVGTSPERRAQAHGVVDVARGYRAWRAGDPEEAARRLSRSVHTPTFAWASWRGLWRGDLYRELGEPRRAEGWYLAAWWHPLAHFGLGRVYEEMGEPEQAAAAYRRFLTAWEGADEPLRDRIEAARDRLRRLTGEASEAPGG